MPHDHPPRDVESLLRENERLKSELAEASAWDNPAPDLLAGFLTLGGATGHVFWLAAPRPLRVLYASPGFERVWGEAVADLYRTPYLWLERVHPDDRDRVGRELEDWIENRTARYESEYRVVRRDGEERWIWDQAAKIFDGSGNLTRINGIANDITEQKRSQIALLESEQKYRVLFESMSQGTIHCDADCKIIDANPAAEAILGISDDRLRGIGATDPRWRWSREDGTEFPPDEQPTALALRTGRPVNDILMGLMHLTERNQRSILVSAVPQFKAGLERPIGVFATFIDISERQALEHQLRQAQKMEALGTLVGGIAHDFNNVLAGLMGKVFLVRQQCAALPAMLEHLDAAEKLGERAARTVSQLLTFARKSKLKKSSLSLNTVVSESLGLIRSTVPEDIELRAYVCPEPLFVHGDVTQLQQVLINLIGNARDALAGATQPRLEVELTTVDSNDPIEQSHPELRGRRLARLTIGDNGCGIAPDVQKHVFEPFFTTKAVGQGTGLGLAMVYGAVTSHGGAVELVSEEGAGTRIHLYLPLADAAGVEDRPDRRAVVSARRNETVLVADDQDFVRSMLREVLATLGYRVLEACDGREAVDLFESRQDEIDLVLLDAVMPKMGGLDAARRIRAFKVDVPVIFCTGYDAVHGFEGTQPLERSLIMQKPFSIQELSDAVGRMIDSDD